MNFRIVNDVSSDYAQFKYRSKFLFNQKEGEYPSGDDLFQQKKYRRTNFRLLDQMFCLKHCAGDIVSEWEFG